VTNTQDDEQVNTMDSPGVVSCWECTIEKSMDNVVISKHDEKEHSAITGQFLVSNILFYRPRESLNLVFVF
jgi:hypothetical protein